MNRKLLAQAGACLALIASGCAKPADPTVADSSATHSGAASGSKSSEGTVYRLKLHKLYDTTSTGKLVGTFLLPEGWTSKNSVQWIPGNFMTPVFTTASIKSPDGELQIDTMSGLERNFMRAPAGNSGDLPPASLSKFLLQAWKKDHPGVNPIVTTLKDTPVTIPTQVPPGMEAKMVNGLLKLTFKKGGKNYLVKLQATMLASQSVPTQTGMGLMTEGGWLIGNLYQVTAPEKRLPEAMKVAGIILTSVRVDPHWFSLVSKVQAQISQATYGQIAQAGQLSNIISQTNDEISDTIMSSYSANQTAQDRSAQNFDDYINGVDRYQDGDSRVGLPSGYAHAWKDSQDNYIVTDDHLYNPNVSGPGGSWTELQRAP